MLEICKKLFSQLSESKICYCHWKSNEHLREGLDGKTDLDVLLEDEDKKRCYKILVDLDFLYCKSQYGSRYPNVVDWVGFDEKSGRMIHLHLHFRMVTGHKGMKEYSLPWYKEVLDTRLQDNETGVYVSDANYEIVTLYSRIGLKAHAKHVLKAKKGVFELDDNYKREISYLKERVSFDVVKTILEKYYEDSWQDMYNIIELPILDSESFLKLKSITEQVMAKYSRFSKPAAKIWEVYFFFAGQIRSKLRKKMGYNLILKKTPYSNCGLTIAFLGQDGAGKSTITEDIEGWLKWKLDAERVYLGSGDHFNPWEKKLQRVLKKDFIIFTLLRAWLSCSIYVKLSRNVLKSICRAERYANKGGIALYDRFPQTHFPGINDGPKIRSKLLPKTTNHILKMILKILAYFEETNLKKAEKHIPNIVIKLMLSPEESIRRKPENDIKVIQTKHKVIKSLHFESANVYEVNAEQDYCEELRNIKSIIWSNLIEKVKCQKEQK